MNNEDTKSVPVYLVQSKDELLLYVAGILDIYEEDFNKGADYLVANNKSFEILLNIFNSIWNHVESNGEHGLSILMENNYVDRIYRDSYYFYYSGKHSSYSRYCKRIYFFSKLFDSPIFEMDEKILSKYFIGSIVIRPIPERSIGRTLINPRFLIDNETSYIRLAKYDISMFGIRLTVEAFPFSMQDGETTTCAEITILNILDFYSRSYQDYSYILPSEINLIARKNGFERSLPTRGLRYEMISKTLVEAGFDPRLYHSKTMSPLKFKHTLYSYVESGIPVALGLDTDKNTKHSVVVIGHGECVKDRLLNNVYCGHDPASKETLWFYDSADTVNDYCLMDDTKKPYTISAYSDDKRPRINDSIIETMLIPLYKKMYLESTDAKELFRAILVSDSFGISSTPIKIGETLYGTPENPYVLRIFMASSRGFRRQRNRHFIEVGNDAIDYYHGILFPKFIWVCEISTFQDYPERIHGEIVLDATASPSMPGDSLILAHYPGRIYHKTPDDSYDDIFNQQPSDDNVNFDRIVKWAPFSCYDSNLDKITV